MIIGICGLIGSGKGTVADTLVGTHNFKKISFADRLKDGVAAIFGWDRDALEGDTDESRYWREQKDQYWSSETGREITPRLVLQEFGTDCMRNGFYDGIWVSMVKQDIINNPETNWVIPDVRFPNEIDMIKSVGGEVWQIRRGDLPQWFTAWKDYGMAPPPDIHQSEYMWIDADSNFDRIIHNNGTYIELAESIRDLVKSPQASMAN